MFFEEGINFLGGFNHGRTRHVSVVCAGGGDVLEPVACPLRDNAELGGSEGSRKVVSPFIFLLLGFLHRARVPKSVFLPVFT